MIILELKSSHPAIESFDATKSSIGLIVALACTVVIKLRIHSPKLL